jgi:hypothetical protein
VSSSSRRCWVVVVESTMLIVNGGGLKCINIFTHHQTIHLLCGVLKIYWSTENPGVSILNEGAQGSDNFAIDGEDCRRSTRTKIPVDLKQTGLMKEMLKLWVWMMGMLA